MAQEAERISKVRINHGDSDRLVISLYKAVRETRCTVQTTKITTFGVLKNKYYGVVDSEVVIDDLFE